MLKFSQLFIFFEYFSEYISKFYLKLKKNSELSKLLTILKRIQKYGVLKKEGKVAQAQALKKLKEEEEGGGE